MVGGILDGLPIFFRLGLIFILCILFIGNKIRFFNRIIFFISQKLFGVKFINLNWTFFF
jgi:hypothetical protein